jgi:hypothetical protein
VASSAKEETRNAFFDFVVVFAGRELTKIYCTLYRDFIAIMMFRRVEIDGNLTIFERFSFISASCLATNVNNEMKY